MNYKRNQKTKIKTIINIYKVKSKMMIINQIQRKNKIFLIQALKLLNQFLQYFQVITKQVKFIHTQVKVQFQEENINEIKKN